MPDFDRPRVRLDPHRGVPCVEPAGVVDALCDGVGRGKAFGFGLLTLSGEGWTWWR